MRAKKIILVEKGKKEMDKAAKGFSLVITISLMVLLSLIAVGLLSLTTTTLRSTAAGEAQSEARGNARMAAIMAIAQLQELTGLDTRVTASAKLPNSSNIDVSGVWRSWEGTNHGDDGKPIVPAYESKNSFGDPSEPLGTPGAGKFLGYLTSTSVGSESDPSSVPGSSTTEGGSMIKMVGEGSVNNGERVYLEPTFVSNEDSTTSGAISWWTSGDNTKALLNTGPVDDASEASDWQQRLRGNRLPDPDVFGLAELDGMSKEDAFIPSRRSLELLGSSDFVGDNFYDVTTNSRGLMTNVATGGWRKDLSLFSEFYDDLPGSGLRLFSNLPGESFAFNQTTQSNNRPSNALLYHWKRYSDHLGGGQPWQSTPPICSWSALVNYMKSYENLTSSSPNSVVMNAAAGRVGGGNGQRYPFQEMIRVHPQVARIQWVLSLGSRQVGEEFIPGIVVTPIITLWNPYNVALTVSGYSINFQEIFPIRLSYEIDGQPFDSINLRDIVSEGGVGNINADFPTIVLGPGENKVYGINSNVPTTNANLSLTEGYQPNGGVIFERLDNSNDSPDRTVDSTLTITEVEFAANSVEGVTAEAIGVRFSASSLGNGNEIIVISYGVDDLGGQNIVDQIYPPIAEPLPVTLGDVVGGDNVPFATATLALRVASPTPPDTRFENLKTKGMLQSNPLQHYAEVGAANDNGARSTLAGSGAYHPINSPYDFVIQEAQDWNDSAVTVDFDPSTNRGFLISGNRAGTGVMRSVVAELPTRPLQSLADLQHFDARNNNQLPPFQFNLVGNSSAHPIFGRQEIEAVVSPQANFPEMSNDDPFLLNHVLFDDWFMSSVAPDLGDFSSSVERPMQQVLIDFLSGEDELPNNRYVPGPLARDEEPEDIVQTYLSGDLVEDTGLYPFEIFASLFEVEGMFNINSVSVDAWKAVLRQNRDLEVPVFDNSDGVSTAGTNGTVFPRSTISRDAGNSNSIESLVNGYRSLTDDQIDGLAEAIVLEIRNRGPFLSLSEFVNRQLSDDTDTALAGTIQRALDKIAEGGSSASNPYAELMALGEVVTSEPPGVTDYGFPEAALGSTLFGVPGWLRQADVLRPLAPVISARDDTFTIRAYGDSRDRSGSIVAQAWCEVVVQRTANYIDEADSPQVVPFSNEMTSEANRRFGRRYQLVSFRWLNEEEV